MRPPWRTRVGRIAAYNAVAMVIRPHLHASDLRGVARIAKDATSGLTDLVEAMHTNIARPRGTGGITGLVYKSIRGVTHLVGGGVDALLALLTPAFGGRPLSPEREVVLAALNGVLGDYLAASDNPLAIRMSLRREGQPIVSSDHQRRVVVLVHGLCMSDLQWKRNGHEHGACLERDLGYAPLYLHYNSGLHVSANGRRFADLLEQLVSDSASTIEELVVVAHSMGGLVTRSACHYGAAAGHAWLARLRGIVFLGTPHHGAPLERGGNWIDIILGAAPYAAPLARLGKIRSAGITDLRFGNLLDEDWEGRDRFARTRDTRRHVPLPVGVPCYAIAATIGKTRGDLKDRLLGDGLVPLASALGVHKRAERCLAFPQGRQWVGHGINHLDLLDRPAVWAQIRDWLAHPA